MDLTGGTSTGFENWKSEKVEKGGGGYCRVFFLSHFVLGRCRGWRFLVIPGPGLNFFFFADA